MTPVRLVVVVVNYNVRYFLEQALGAVRKASQGLSVETWVVDNHSVDGSVEMVRERFPEVRLIANTDNPGFSVANNQAIRASESDYVLLLNPDTVVEESTFAQCLAYMDAHPEVGGLGVRMIDGSGRFLPESKRGFPSAWVAFCKTFGLARFFPKSERFNRYHMGHLSEFETAEVDVLAGAYMWMRRSVLDKVGLLDETFFMYGEDIDLSYRIQKAGFKNVYFADTTIIHYKGESTKKGSLNYVRTFYQAMIIFARKHFTGRQAYLFVLLLQAAIWFRALLTMTRNMIAKVSMPLLDTVIILLGMWWLKGFWGQTYYKEPDYYKTEFLYINTPLYMSFWLVSVWLHGGYDRRGDLRALVRGVVLGTIFLAAVYGFLPMWLRSSRALVVLGAVWTLGSMVGTRLLLDFIQYRDFRLGAQRSKNIMIVGTLAERKRVEALLYNAQVSANIVCVLDPMEKTHQHNMSSTLEEMTTIFRVDEIIFCSKDIDTHLIMSAMSDLGPSIGYKIVPEESMSIIGSRSKNEPGELYVLDIEYCISRPQLQRFKRIMDIVFSLVLLLFLPFAWLPGLRKLPVRCWKVFFGKATWVSYQQLKDVSGLPKQKLGFFSPADAWPKRTFDTATKQRLCYLYAKDYKPELDVEVMLKNFGQWGR